MPVASVLVISAIYEIERETAAETVALRASIGMAPGPGWARGGAVERSDGRAVAAVGEVGAAEASGR